MSIADISDNPNAATHDGPADLLGAASLASSAPVLTPAVLSQAAIDLGHSPDQLDRRLDDVQHEINSLRNECNQLRRRDETLQFYMTRLDEELRLAARLQQDFLPRSLPEVGSVRFHTVFRPAGYVSGDMYDVLRLDEHRVGFYIADAVGHGMPAALLTMFLKHNLTTKKIRDGNYRLLPPSESLARLNVAMLEQNLSQASFATALYGMIDTRTLTLTIARAGHPIPLLLRADGSAPVGVESDGGLLGVFPEETYTDKTIQLSPGDRLVCFTDGVEMCCGEEATLDLATWNQLLEETRPLPGEQAVLELSRRFDIANGSLQPRDDLTLILIDV